MIFIFESPLCLSPQTVHLIVILILLHLILKANLNILHLLHPILFSYKDDFEVIHIKIEYKTAQGT